MCPFCKDKDCKVIERPDGELACECGKHSWPSSAIFDEACRKASLTVGRTVHMWTQAL